MVVLLGWFCFLDVYSWHEHSRKSKTRAGTNTVRVLALYQTVAISIGADTLAQQFSSSSLKGIDTYIERQNWDVRSKVYIVQSI
jgi:hypothetical protein